MANANEYGPIDHDYPSLEHLIIWLDRHIGKPGECQQLKRAFASYLDPRFHTRTTLNERDQDNLIRMGDIMPIQFAGIPFHLLAFDDPHECYEAFERHRHKRIYFITSGTMGEHIVPTLVAHHPELFSDPVTQNPYGSIYIFCGNIEYHFHWLSDIFQYVQAFTHEADLLARMTRDVANYCVARAEQYLVDARRHYQWAKKGYDNYEKLGQKCTEELQKVEVRTAEIERIIRPRIVNPHVFPNASNADGINPNNDEEQTSEAAS